LGPLGKIVNSHCSLWAAVGRGDLCGEGVDLADAPLLVLMVLVRVAAFVDARIAVIKSLFPLQAYESLVWFSFGCDQNGEPQYPWSRDMLFSPQTPMETGPLPEDLRRWWSSETILKHGPLFQQDFINSFAMPLMLFPGDSSIW